MMLSAAGAGVVHPLQFGVKRKMPAWAWAAVGASVALHGGAAVWLALQAFKTPEPVYVEKTIDVFIPRTIPPPPTEEVKPDPRPRPKAEVDIHQPPPLPIDPPKVAPFPPTQGEVKVSGPPTSLGGDADGVKAAPPAPPAPGPRVIVEPKWVAMPDAAAMARWYPARAQSEGVNGSATLRCTVTGRGTVENCVVLSETPQGFGFGRSAVNLSRYFRMSPRTENGQAVEGAEVTIPLRFDTKE